MKAGAQNITQIGQAANQDHSNINFSDLNSMQKEEGEVNDEETSQQLYEVTLEN